jgi:alkanesulfonate monooxygenase SsuD/methylene tetrahydromethanopterin reductase-like flavin-dependent oxidoreductase (luciferase family)
VGETDEIARREAQPHIENFLNKFLRMPKEMLLPPGYLSLKSMIGVMKAKSAIGGKQTIDDVIDKGMFICGSPETVRQKLESYQKEIGFGHLLTMLQFGTLPAELTRKNMELFAASVMPHLRARSAASVAQEPVAA